MYREALEGTGKSEKSLEGTFVFQRTGSLSNLFGDQGGNTENRLAARLSLKINRQ